MDLVLFELICPGSVKPDLRYNSLFPKSKRLFFASKEAEVIARLKRDRLSGRNRRSRWTRRIIRVPAYRRQPDDSSARAPLAEHVSRGIDPLEIGTPLAKPPPKFDAKQASSGTVPAREIHARRLLSRDAPGVHPGPPSIGPPCRRRRPQRQGRPGRAGIHQRGDLQPQRNGLHTVQVERQDAHHLTYANDAFDFVIVHAALHHCSSPHAALVEMYRVARRGVLAIEARDSLMARTLVRLGLSPDYEPSAVYFNASRAGGVNNSEIPNFIYRWTEREVEKTIAAAAPHAVHAIRYRYGGSMPHVAAL